MGTGNSGEQKSSRNTVFGPEMGLVKRHEKEYPYWLTRIPGLGAATIRRIWKMAGSLERAYYIEGMELKKSEALQNGKKRRMYDRRKERFSGMVREYNYLQERGIRFVMPLDREHPKRPLRIHDYPMGFHVRGELLDERYPTAAIIGARNCSEYGRWVAGFMEKELTRAGVQIVSGLAPGMNRVEHGDALNGGGGTYEALGCGVNIYHPRNDYYLYKAAPFQGGIPSEFGPDEEPMARNFPMRNHIISGLSDVVLITEVRGKSGSLITVSLDPEQGKEISALLGRITDDLSTECNELMQSGAGILTSPRDVPDYMSIFHEKKCINHEGDQKGLAKIKKTVYNCLDSRPRYLEQIMVQIGLLAGRCMSAFPELKLEGFAARASGQSYMKTIT